MKFFKKIVLLASISLSFSVYAKLDPLPSNVTNSPTFWKSIKKQLIERVETGELTKAQAEQIYVDFLTVYPYKHDVNKAVSAAEERDRAERSREWDRNPSNPSSREGRDRAERGREWDRNPVNPINRDRAAREERDRAERAREWDNNPVNPASPNHPANIERARAERAKDKDERVASAASRLGAVLIEKVVESILERAIEDYLDEASKTPEDANRREFTPTRDELEMGITDCRRSLRCA